MQKALLWCFKIHAFSCCTYKKHTLIYPWIEITLLKLWNGIKKTHNISKTQIIFMWFGFFFYKWTIIIFKLCVKYCTANILCKKCKKIALLLQEMTKMSKNPHQRFRECSCTKKYLKIYFVLLNLKWISEYLFILHVLQSQTAVFICIHP